MGYQCITPFLKFLYVLMFLVSLPKYFAHRKHGANNSVPAILIFGDSYIDAGNNNYVMNTMVRANFPPYGRDFPNHLATGRFSNGKVFPDFIASYLGIKETVPAYLDPKLTVEEIKTGVNFGSAGSGYDPLTTTLTGAIPMAKQLKNFKEYKKRLQSIMTKDEIKKHLKKTVFVICCISNDLAFNYLTVPLRKTHYTPSAYQKYIVRKSRQFIKDLRELGARRVIAYGAPPLGCLPLIITIRLKDTFLQRECVENDLKLSKEYNQKLKNELSIIQKETKGEGGKVVYGDLYNPMIDMVKNPTKHGIEVAGRSCCGTGYAEATSYLCNAMTPVSSDADKYIFWDSAHPTENTHHEIFLASRSTIDKLIKS
ncbi:hypothetical protein GIB67_039275 [Kingdonia uniflora]|uniref:GDSL esterase/lipase n=1 Tax=Kingdonia uniflora TaxID=39325 RepID=A0A7J7MMA4_9MAGN|nr:hypothetical protein GIB67_039275 [Kingdonia uniflora]